MTNSNSKYPNTTEQSVWICQARQGDQDAFCRLVEKYQQPVFNICYRMLNNAEDAEDAAQEIFLRAYTKLDTYDTDRRFSTWLFAIASHYCIDRWKKRSFQLVAWDDLKNVLSDSESNQPDRIVAQRDADREVRDLLVKLPADYRMAVVLRYWQTMSYDEMAETLNTSVSAVKSRLFRARKMLAQSVRSEQARLGGTGPLARFAGC
jgi:RNA polymerase sigma-70 factor (ECF subfamily)